MKRLLVVFFTVFVLLMGCNNTAQQVKQPVGNNEQNIMPNFEKLMEQQPTEKEVIAFLDAHIKSLTPKESNKLILAWEEMQRKNLETWQNKFFNASLQQAIDIYITDGYINKDNVDKITDAKIKTLILQTLDSGYKLICPEGSLYPIIDYQFTYQRYKDYVDPDISDYLKIRAMESSQPTVIDAGLTISWHELFNRALVAENFLKNYPHSSKYDVVKEMYKNYSIYYLFGVDNTPVFDYQTGTIRNEVKESYIQAANYCDSKLGSVAKDYLVVIEKNNDKLTSEVEEFRTTYKEEFKFDFAPPIKSNM